MKQNKGITLISLVLTIVICLILSGVVIATLSGNDGIPEMAGEAVNKAQLAIDESNNAVKDSEEKIEEYALSYIQRLQKKYELSYYSNLELIINDINNGTIGATDDSEESLAAFAGYTDENGELCVVMMKDITLEQMLSITKDMTLDLGQKTLFVTNDAKIEVETGKLTLKGGTYKSISNGEGTDANPNASIIIGANGELTVNNVDIVANDTEGGTLVGISVEEGGVTSISNSNIEVNSPNGLKSDGIRNCGTVTISNTNIVAYSNYTANAAGNDYATSTRGINNEGTMTLKNCYVYGNHSGVRSAGTLYIDGGTYEGYGHGGFYLWGANTTSYVKNATVRLCEMKNGYDDGIAGTNKAGFYIGGASNVTVYMDNCELYGSYYPLVMRKSGGEDNNSLYISNSTLLEGYSRYIRIESTKNNKIYIGVGNNFTTENAVAWTSNGVQTDIDYGTQFPEY